MECDKVVKWVIFMNKEIHFLVWSSKNGRNSRLFPRVYSSGFMVMIRDEIVSLFIALCIPQLLQGMLQTGMIIGLLPIK